MSTQTKPPPAASIEDFDEASGNSLPETRKVANVAAKRSRPELDAKLVGSVDGTSDSDYSNRTAGTGATQGSTESEPKRPQASTHLKLDTTFQDKPSIQDRERRPYGREMKLDSGQPRENRPAVQRRPSKARKEESVRHPPGTCWDCDERGGHAPTPKPSSQPAKIVTIPSSPSRHRKETPSQPKQEHKLQEYAEGRPRPRRSSSTHRSASRPSSFHAGTTASLPAEAAYSYPHYSAAPQWPQMHSFIPYSCPPSSFPTTFPTPVTPISTTPVASYYEPPLPQTPTYSRRLSSHGPPVIRQDYPPSPADHRPPSPWKHHRESSVPRRQDREEDYQRMPPPPRPQSTIPRRPSVKKHVTTTSAEILHQPKHSDPRPLSRSSSHRRPSDAERHVQVLPRPQNRKTVSYEDSATATRRPERPITRRRTLYGHEAFQDLERKQLEAEEYQRSKGTDSLPMTADSLEKARNPVAPAKKSEAGSHRSRNSSNRDSTVKAHGSDITMTMNGVALGFSGDSVESKDIRIKSKPSGMSIQIEGKKPRRHSLARIQGPPSEKDKDKVMRADASEKGSRKSSRSGRSGK
ncbi:MAG: hypothetical protein Q9160_002769 [Pyrenula sp. 1 TL-2023]